MALRMHENSLFAILLRAPWWVSLAVALGLFGALRLLVAPLYAAMFAAPFLVITAVAGWRALRRPSAARIEAALAELKTLKHDEFLQRVQAGYARRGYRVSRLQEPEADYLMEREGRRAIVGCKRWKAARVGIDPLTAFVAAARVHDASERFLLVTGALSDAAARAAQEGAVTVVSGADLALLAGDLE